LLGIVAPDPTGDEANQLCGVQVLPTTQITAGDGLLLDTNKFEFVAVRETISLRTGTNDDDFTRNLVRWVSEERLELAVERPAAALSITGLPTYGNQSVQGIQVAHEGERFAEGETDEVPDCLAQKWIRAGWVTEVKPVATNQRPGQVKR
jgi:hypothetical protein